MSPMIEKSHEKLSSALANFSTPPYPLMIQAL
jgi:hypothetical protein